MFIEPNSNKVWCWAGLLAITTGSACASLDEPGFGNNDDDDSNGTINHLPTGSGGTGSTNTTPPPGGTGGTTTVPTEPMSLADGVAITAISINQAIRRPLMENQQPVASDIPIVENRAALVRVFYQADSTQVGKVVTASLTFDDNEPLFQKATLGGDSSVSDFNSTINFDVPGTQMHGSAYRIELLVPTEETSGNNVDAAYPATGQQSIKISSSGNKFKIVLVPVRYGADGSNRLPDTSPAQLDRYRDTFYGMFPTPEVSVSVGPVLQWNASISANGSGWNGLLDAVVDLRKSNGAARNEFYYGIFRAAQSMNAFCGQGCVAGLSLMGQPQQAFFRAGIGMGFSGVPAAETAAHEIGHQLGRGHAPCGTNQGLDNTFPNAGAAIADWGFDLVTRSVVPPQFKDLMSYCEPTWISGHNFRETFNFLRQVNNVAAKSLGIPRSYERVRVNPDGTVSWGKSLTLHAAPGGAATTITAAGSNGETALKGHFYPYSHLEGGIMVFPKGSIPAKEVSFQLATKRYTAHR